MNYPLSLDEYSNEAIEQEFHRRQNMRRLDKCYYCEKPLDNNTPCKIHQHDGSSQE